MTKRARTTDRTRLLGACLLAGLLVCAGCVSPLTGTGDTPASGQTPVDVEATVERVVDGDTVEVRFDDGSTETVRLLGVDVPETRAESQPGEFEGVPDTEAGRTCLRRAGEEATVFARERLAGERVRVQTDPRADRRGGYGRLLAYVSVVDGATAGNSSFNERLLERGHARLFDSTFERRDRFAALERGAREADRSLWRCRTP
jgi:micrococcal nuclease